MVHEQSYEVFAGGSGTGCSDGVGSPGGEYESQWAAIAPSMYYEHKAREAEPARSGGRGLLPCANEVQ